MRRSTADSLLRAAELAEEHERRYRSRKRVNRAALALSLAAMAFGVFWLVWILWSTVQLGVGGLNWALVGLFDFDLVATLFGDMSLVTRIVYVVVGLCAIYALTLIPRLSRRANTSVVSAP